MVEQGTNVVDKKRIQHLGNLFLIGEVQRAIVRNPYNNVSELAPSCVLQRYMMPNLPDTFQMHRPNLDNMTDFFTLQNAVSTATGHTSNI